MGNQSCTLRKQVSSFAVLVLLLMLGACASQSDKQQHVELTTPQQTGIVVNSGDSSDVIEPTVVSYPAESFNDPLESINRPIFAFNEVIYDYAFIPLSKGYLAVMPKPAQQSVSNFFANIREPLNAINHLAQANGTNMGSSVARFLINSTLGILGLFDPADAWFEIKEEKSTLGDTLQHYGVDYGLYLVFPLLGPTDARNGFSSIVESIASPINQVSDNPQTFYIQAYEGFHDFAPQAESFEKLFDESDDPYLFFRNMYLQGVLRDEQYDAK